MRTAKGLRGHRAGAKNAETKAKGPTDTGAREAVKGTALLFIQTRTPKNPGLPQTRLSIAVGPPSRYLDNAIAK